MESQLHKISNHESLLMAIEATLTTLASYYLCSYVAKAYGFVMPEIAGLWGAISAIFVLNPKRTDVIHTSWMRFWGTVAGSLIPMACVYAYGGYQGYTFASAIFITVIVVSLCRIREAYKTACITVIVVFVIGSLKLHQIAPWVNALSRLCESTLGIITSLIIDLVLYPIRKHFDLF